MSEGLYVHILFICNIIRCKVVFTVDINENTDTKVRVVWVLLVSDQKCRCHQKPCEPKDQIKGFQRHAGTGGRT